MQTAGAPGRNRALTRFSWNVPGPSRTPAYSPSPGATLRFAATPARSEGQSNTGVPVAEDSTRSAGSSPTSSAW